MHDMTLSGVALIVVQPSEELADHGPDERGPQCHSLGHHHLPQPLVGPAVLAVLQRYAMTASNQSPQELWSLGCAVVYQEECATGLWVIWQLLPQNCIKITRVALTQVHNGIII